MTVSQPKPARAVLVAIDIANIATRFCSSCPADAEVATGLAHVANLLRVPENAKLAPNFPLIVGN